MHMWTVELVLVLHGPLWNCRHFFTQAYAGFNKTKIQIINYFLTKCLHICRMQFKNIKNAEISQGKRHFTKMLVKCIFFIGMRVVECITGYLQRQIFYESFIVDLHLQFNIKQTKR